MYYHLNNNYCLRGWELLPYAIVDSETHRAHFVQKAEFDALTLCDGTLCIAVIIQRFLQNVGDVCRHAGYKLFNAVGIEKIVENGKVAH